MLDPNFAIRTAYYTALNNTIQYGNGTVPFYDHVPSSATYPYIYAAGFTCVEQGDKSYFGYDVTMTLSVAMKYKGNSGGQKDIDLIIKAIGNRIRGAYKNSTPVSFGVDFQNAVTTLENSNAFKESVTDGIIYYRTMTFKHKVAQLNNN